MSNQTWASIAKKHLPPQVSVNSNLLISQAISQAISTRNATKHAAVRSKYAARQHNYAEMQRMDRNGQALEHYENRSMQRLFRARVYDAAMYGHLPKDLASDLV